eukprot:529122_1
MSTLCWFASIICLSYGYIIELNTVPNDMIVTPHGIRPKECVISHNSSNVTLEQTVDGIWAYYNDLNTTKFFPTQTKCVENSKQIISDYYDVNGWQYAARSVKTDELNDISYYGSKYKLPDEDLVKNTDPLYYMFLFIGLTPQGHTQQNVTILQPVASWCSGDNCQGQGVGGWYMLSWNCCPNGETHHAKAVKMIKGDTADTYITTNPHSETVTVYAKVASNGGTSILTQKGDYRNFDQLAIAEEVYNINECKEFNDLPMIFNEQLVKDKNGNKINMDSIKWTMYNEHPLNCGGALKFTHPNSTQIIGTTK